MEELFTLRRKIQESITTPTTHENKLYSENLKVAWPTRDAQKTHKAEFCILKLQSLSSGGNGKSACSLLFAQKITSVEVKPDSDGGCIEIRALKSNNGTRTIFLYPDSTQFGSLANLIQSMQTGSTTNLLPSRGENLVKTEEHASSVAIVHSPRVSRKRRAGLFGYTPHFGNDSNAAVKKKASVELKTGHKTFSPSTAPSARTVRTFFSSVPKRGSESPPIGGHDIELFQVEDSAVSVSGDERLKTFISSPVKSSPKLVSKERATVLHSDKSLNSPANPLVRRQMFFGSPAKKLALEQPLPDNARRRGLRNLGNSCYLNSIVQAISSLPSLLQALQSQPWTAVLRDKLSSDDKENRSDEGNKDSSTLAHVSRDFHSETPEHLRVLSSLLHTVAQLQSQDAVVNPDGFKRAMGSRNDIFASFTQQDAHEFFVELLQHLEADLQFAIKHAQLQKAEPFETLSPSSQEIENQNTLSTPKPKPLDSWIMSKITPDDKSKAQRRNDPREYSVMLCKEKDVISHSKAELPNYSLTQKFETTVDKIICCDLCGYTRRRQETFYDFSIELDDVARPEGETSTQPEEKNTKKEGSSLRLQNLLAQHFRQHKVTLNCEKCESGVASVQYEFLSLPTLLVVHVKRFKVTSNLTYTKVHTPIEFDNFIELDCLSKETSKTATFNMVEPSETSTRWECQECTFDNNDANDSVCQMCDGTRPGGNKQSESWVCGKCSSENTSQGLACTSCGAIKDTNPSPSSYELQSIVHHLGQDASVGHYITDIRDIKSMKWERRDDSLTTEMSAVEATTGQAQKSCYMFFFVKEALARQLRTIEHA